MEKSSLRLVGYARVSAQEQAKNGYSIEAQTERIRAWCAENGHELRKIFVEPGRSGSKSYTTHRPAFETALRYVQVGLADGIVVRWIDRFSRNVVDFLTIRSELYQDGKQIISIEEPLLNGDPTDPVERFLATAIMNAHQLMAEISGQKAALGRDRRARAGHYPGTTPIGYLRVEREVVVDPEHGPEITAAFIEFSTGKYTLDAWSSEASRRGYTTRRGKTISRGQWARIFRNKFYIGIFTWKGEEYEGDYEPLIAPATFQAVQLILDERGPEPGQKHHFWLLAGLLWSDVHHKMMTGALIKNRYRYYRATKRGQPEHNITAGDIEQEAEQLLKTIIYTGEPISIPENWRLAFEVAENMATVYQKIKTDHKKRDLLRLIFPRRGIRVAKGGHIIEANTLPGFILVE